MAELNFIFDRTLNDVIYARDLQTKLLNGTATDEEIAEYQKDLKGARNKSDLDRNWTNVRAVADMMELAGIEVPQQPEFPNNAYFEKLLTAVQALRDNWVVHKSTPLVPVTPLTNYQKWNDIERILFDLYEILSARVVYNCGSGLYSGGDIGLLE